MTYEEMGDKTRLHYVHLAEFMVRNNIATEKEIELVDGINDGECKLEKVLEFRLEEPLCDVYNNKEKKETLVWDMLTDTDLYFFDCITFEECFGDDDEEE
jgi:hypothetical protein